MSDAICSIYNSDDLKPNVLAQSYILQPVVDGLGDTDTLFDGGW